MGTITLVLNLYYLIVLKHQQNTYTIKHKGEKVTLLTLLYFTKDQKDPNVFFLDGIFFPKVVKREKAPCYALVIFPKDDRPKKVMKEVKPLRHVSPKKVTNLLD